VRTVPSQETLTVEFKSDQKPLSDRDLIATVVCLANTEGGVLYLGVEDDGSITGLHTSHQQTETLAAFIANRTNPPVSIRINVLEEEGHLVAAIEVPKSNRLVATSEGLIQRRRINAHGIPECVPFYPYEFASRQADLGLLDYSALPIPEASLDAFDPLEQERLRQMVERYRGDTSLLALTDEELEGALGMTRTYEGRKVPTITGLLLLGRESALREHLPTHEVAFQVREANQQIRVNDFYRFPLLKTFERLSNLFEARLEEDEIQWGLFRVPIPNYDPRAFREAAVNALIHRDYTKLGTVFIRMEVDSLSISNPGGFVEGVTLDNLLVVEPKPRNPALADAIKRIGLAERTGRGVDLIFQGLLRYGRPAPDYTSSDTSTVKVVLSCTEADIPFYKMIVEEESRTGRPIPLDALIMLSRLRQERRIDTAMAAHAIQKNDSVARSVLERLVEAGLVEPRGATRGRTYMLSPKIYRSLGESAEYVRQVGFEPIQQAEMVLRFTQTNGQVTRREVSNLCHLSDSQASNLLRHLQKEGKLQLHGQGRGAYYTIA
jgi:ATP-dependent DNA helicase RecG